MQVEMYKIVNSIDALKELSSTKLKATVSFRVSKILAQVQDTIEHFNNTRQSLFDEYGEQSDDKQTMEIKPENTEKYQEEMRELLEEKVEVSANPIKIDDLGDIQIAPSVLSSLSWLIEE